MTVEEYFENWTASQKKFTTWREGSVQFAEAYHTYRLAFERENKQSTADPYYTDPATWPEWANWRAVDMDGRVYVYGNVPSINEDRESWVPSYTFDSWHIGVAPHNPDWRTSLRGREEVSGGK